MGKACNGGQTRPASAAAGPETRAAESAARRAALADTATRICRPTSLPGCCPACREVTALLRRQNRLLERLLEAMGVQV